jgi:hypothetical protein
MLRCSGKSSTKSNRKIGPVKAQSSQHLGGELKRAYGMPRYPAVRQLIKTSSLHKKNSSVQEADRLTMDPNSAVSRSRTRRVAPQYLTIVSAPLSLR